MQVFEHQHERLGRGHDVEGLGHLPQHALLCGAQHPALQSLQRRRTNQSGHLHQPGGRLLAQDLHHVRASWPSTQPLHGLQDRQIGFPCPVVVEALPAPNPQRTMARCGGEEHIDQRRFPEPRFSRDKEELTCSGQGCGQTVLQRLQFRLTPREQRRKSAARGRGRWGC